MLCNSRGMDDGYLFVHSKHPLDLDLSTLMEAVKESKIQVYQKVLILDYQQG